MGVNGYFVILMHINACSRLVESLLVKYSSLTIDQGKERCLVLTQDDITTTIGTRVRAARAKAGMSRKKLAEASDVSERYLNQLENGDANVSIGILSRVATALALELTQLLPTERTDYATSQGPLAALIGQMSPREQTDAVRVLETYLRDRRKSQRGIALLGLRGAGKSTIGEMFARQHGMPFLSVTREIEARAGMTLPDLFNLGGPDAYRNLENEVVKDLSARTDSIVLETAGGIVSNTAALDMILSSFRTVWLKAAPHEHLQRVVRQGDMRPMRETPEALDHLKALLAQREQEYARADYALDTTGLSPDACVQRLEVIAGLPARLETA